MRLVFDPRVGLKRFFNKVINLFSPTRGSNRSRITNSMPLFSLLNHTLNFHNWRLICVLPSFSPTNFWRWPNEHDNFMKLITRSICYCITLSITSCSSCDPLSSLWSRLSIEREFFLPLFWEHFPYEFSSFYPKKIIMSWILNIVLRVCDFFLKTSFLRSSKKVQFSGYLPNWTWYNQYFFKK